MGIKRGSFEQVELSQQVERAVEHSTIRPDEGETLRAGAGALQSWSDAFGKMADMATKAKGVKDANMATQSACKTAMDSALDTLKDYDAKPDNQKNKEERAKIVDSVSQAESRYNASKSLGVFSGKFDMNRDYTDWNKGQ